MLVRLLKSVNMFRVDSVGETSDRRDDTDRRRQPTPVLSRYWLRGRRRGARRDGEGVNVYVDRYNAGEWAVILAILVLSVCDLFFTIVHLSAGGEEANPVMRWALQWGNLGFGLIKLGTTVLALVILLLHARFRRVRALLTFALVLYSALLVYHLYLRYMFPLGG